jgi:hypothetical protein
MPSSGMLRHVSLVRTDVKEDRIASIMRETKIGELGTTISSQRASVATYCQRCFQLADSCHPGNGGDTFLRNVGSYKSHMTYCRIRMGERRNADRL